MSEPPVSRWFFPIIGAIVLGLAAVSLILSYLGLGWWAVPVAIGIASVQAILVGWFSMELFESRFSVRMLAIIAPLFVILLTVLATADLASRAPEPMQVPPPIRAGFPGGPPQLTGDAPGPEADGAGRSPSAD